MGVISMRSAPLSLPTFSTAQFKRFFDCGRAVRCLLPSGAGRFMHLVVLYGYQGGDADPEQLAVTDQLFDAALGELSVVASPACWLGISTWSPPKSLACQKGFRLDSGLTWRFLGLWLLVSSLLLPVCVSGVLVVAIDVIFVVGCPLAAAAVVPCTVQADRWIAPHLGVRTLFEYDRWSCRVTQPVRYSPLWPASWLPAVENSRRSESVEVQRVWEIHDDRLQFMSRQDALL